MTQNEDLMKRYETKRIDIFVMNMGDYLKQFWPDLTSAFDVYESLLAVHSEKLAEADSKSGKEQVMLIFEAGSILSIGGQAFYDQNRSHRISYTVLSDFYMV